MAAASLDLGGVDLVSTTSGLQLQLSSCAQFAPSEEDEIDRESIPLTQNILTRQLKQAWICRARNFRLVLNLKLTEDLAALEDSTLVGALSDTIRQAELWQQLRLIPTCIETSTSDGLASHVFTIFLDHEDVATDQQRSTLHKLGADVPCRDVKPPAGVTSKGLEAVELALCLSAEQKCKRRKLCEPLAGSYVASELPNEILDNGIFAEEDLEAVHDVDDDLLDGFESGDYGRAPRNGYDCLISDHNCALQPAMPVRKRTTSVAEPRHDQDTLITTASVVSLIDAGIQKAVAGTSKRLGTGIRIKENKSLRSLAELAPVLWSPGYLPIPAVSSRAVFLPTIAHALWNVGSLRARSPALRSKLRKLQGFNSTSSEAPVGQAQQMQQMSIRQQLWSVLQTSLYDERAASQLKPMTPQMDAISQHLGHLLDAMDASQEARHLDFDESWQELHDADQDDDLDEFQCPSHAATSDGHEDAEEEYASSSENDVLEWEAEQMLGSWSDIDSRLNAGNPRPPTSHFPSLRSEVPDEDDLLYMLGSEDSPALTATDQDDGHGWGEAEAILQDVDAEKQILQICRRDLDCCSDTQEMLAI